MDDIEKTIQFILDMQAKHEAWLQKHEEAMTTHEKAITRIDAAFEAGAARAAQLESSVATVTDLVGLVPELLIEHGETADCLFDLLRRDKDISILVLASSAAKEGPGPLVSLFAGPQAAAFPIPVTIVPGRLSDEEIDAMA